VVSREHTLILLEDELSGAQAWATHHDVPLLWVPEVLEMRATFTQPETKDLFYLRGRVDDYREIPPAWTFTDATWAAEPCAQLFPRPAQTPYGTSVFLNQPVICAPFNRLAYKEHEGPHQDWAGPVNWLTAGQPNEVKALFLGDMLSVIHQHFFCTRGRMA
jgi:hypothetical protein